MMTIDDFIVTIIVAGIAAVGFLGLVAGLLCITAIIKTIKD